MKRLLPLMILALALLLGACGGGEKSAPGAAAAAQTARPAPNAVQMDIAGLSTTMAYGQMFSIVNNPGEYVGTSARVKGSYVPLADPAREGLYYHFLVVADITACCEIGVEFFLDGHQYPDDYPPSGAQVELTGVFRMCSVARQEHICLKADSMRVL